MSAVDPRQRLLEQLIRQGGVAAPTAAVAPASSRREPASYGQRRLWFIDQLQQVHAPYTLHAIHRLAFAVDPTLLERSINEIVKRHEVLRTTFALRDDEVVQDIAAELQVPLRVADLSARPEAQREAEALRRIELALGQRFDLEHGPLLRSEAFRLAERDWMLLVAIHHIVSDWQSFQVFFRELDAIYAAGVAGRPHALAAVPAQYAAFAREQRERLTPQRIAEETRFWAAELDGVSMLNLPADRVRPAAPTFRGGQSRLDLPAALVARLQRRAVEARATLFTVLLAGLWAALGRLCGQDDFAIGLPVTCRDSAARQEAIGFYVDTLVVRARWDDDPTADRLLALARGALGRSLAHRALPFEMLVQHLHPVRDLGVNPVFQVGFQLMQHPMTLGDAHGTDPARSGAMFDLCIDLWPAGAGIHGRLQYSADLFDAPTVELVAHALVQALHWIVEPDRHLGELALGAGLDASRLSLLDGGSLPLQGRSCLDLIADVAEREPHRPALEGREGVLTYRELMQRVERLAGAVAERGIAPGSIVVVALERSADLICLQLALMRGGVAFACVDPAWPEERRRRIAAAARAALVVDARAWQALRDAAGDRPAPAPPERTDVAYVIFTSGSSGEPKGVVVEHAGLLNVAHAQRQVFGLGPGRRVAQLSSPTFDASVFETVLAFCSGATLVVAPPGILAGDALERFIDGSAIDTVVIPPSVLATTQAQACEHLRLVCVAGESCPADLARRYRAGREFWNLYGPTETTIWATFGREPVGAKVAIGRPIANLRTAVVDPAGRVVPVGMVGELCIGGIGLARGYLNQQALTAERFVDGLPGLPGRCYRTGDLVRQTRAGDLVFIGRTDRQVKVRGLRIEPEEVEIVLRAHPAVGDVVVDAVPVGGEAVLVAYLQSATADAPALAEACRRLMRERLPAYMGPSRFVVLPAFPRSASGKVDMRALPAPADSTSGGRAWVAPSTPTERKVADLMQQLLHAARVGATDDFFHIGGHSLAAAQLVSRVRALLGVELTIGDVFTHSTVAALAGRIDALSGAPARDDDEIPLVRLPRSRMASGQGPEGIA